MDKQTTYHIPDHNTERTGTNFSDGDQLDFHKSNLEQISPSDRALSEALASYQEAPVSGADQFGRAALDSASNQTVPEFGVANEHVIDVYDYSEVTRKSVNLVAARVAVRESGLGSKSDYQKAA